MKAHSLFIALLLILPLLDAMPKDPPPVIGLSIAAPQKSGLNNFLKFMDEELGPGGVNNFNLYPNGNLTIAAKTHKQV